MKLTPSPCLIEKSSITLSAGIKLLNEAQSSYLLLKNQREELTGIFTKSDLLKVAGEILEDPTLGSRQIHLFMSKPLKFLPLGLIHTAPEFMLKNKFEHVPVLDTENGSEQVVGIVTSDAIFEFMVKLRGIPPIFGGETVRRSRKQVGVLGADGSTYRLIESIYSKSFYVDVERFRFGNFNFVKTAGKVDALVVDIDEIQDRIWIPIVKEIVCHPGLEVVFLVYRPDLHSKVAEGIKRIESSGLFKIFEKPIDVSKLTVDLEKVWSGLNVSA